MFERVDLLPHIGTLSAQPAMLPAGAFHFYARGGIVAAIVGALLVVYMFPLAFNWHGAADSKAEAWRQGWREGQAAFRYVTRPEKISSTVVQVWARFGFLLGLIGLDVGVPSLIWPGPRTFSVVFAVLIVLAAMLVLNVFVAGVPTSRLLPKLHRRGRAP
jgi:hypothetical protein